MAHGLFMSTASITKAVICTVAGRDVCWSDIVLTFPSRAVGIAAHSHKKWITYLFWKTGKPMAYPTAFQASFALN